jgi:hypothetical protein
VKGPARGAAETNVATSDLESYVAGGYFIGRWTDRPAFVSAELLPSRIITASACIVELVPDVWSLAWTRLSEDEREKYGNRFGLVGPTLTAFIAWCTEAFDAGRLGWPNVIFDLAVARELRSRFLAKSDELVLLGIALPRDRVDDFVEFAVPGPAEGEAGILAAIRRGAPLAHGGVASGFDVLGWDWGAFHSYLCNGLEREFDAVLGIRPNGVGLFDRAEDARRCANHAQLDTTAAEPGLWLPWLTVVYGE